MATEAPKVELHVHLDGAWDGQHLYEMAKKYVDFLPESVSIDGKAVPLRQAVRNAESSNSFLQQHVHLPPTTCTLSAFLAPFNWVNAVVLAAIRAEGLVALEDFALHFARRQHQSNVIYTEVRWCPHLLLEQDVLASPDAPARYAAAKAVLAAVSRGLQRGEEMYHIKLKQIMCCVDFMPQISRDLSQLLSDVGHASGCVAIDVAGGEAHFAVPSGDSPILQAVTAARQAGFGSTIHAGEDRNTGGTASNVRRAIEDYGATRIGHGYLALTDESVLNFALKAATHFECCPTSSYLTGGFGPRPCEWTDHPLHLFYKRGLSCSVNTDDPLMCGTCLDDEFWLCVDGIGLQSSQMHAITNYAIDAAFCTAEEKHELRSRVASFYERKLATSFAQCIPCFKLS